MHSRFTNGVAMNSLQGQLLVASPYLTESAFARTVILLVQHNPEGAIGLVLNRPLDQSIKNLWQHLSGTACETDRPLNMGGPVAGPLVAVHREQALAEIDVANGFYVAATKDHLEELIHHPETPFRFFIGHAGWNSGQLENELESGVWFTLPATPTHVFGEFEDLWTATVRQVGYHFLRNTLRVKHIPDNPSLN